MAFYEISILIGGVIERKREAAEKKAEAEELKAEVEGEKQAGDAPKDPAS
jgi:hypothetical protein